LALEAGHEQTHAARAAMTRRRRSVTNSISVAAIIVLVDRIDEPMLVVGRPQCIQNIIRPLLDNKSLQQESMR
jgi:hypothetical protein